MSFDPRKYMKMAIDEMKKSIDEPRADGKPSPRVGAIMINENGDVVGTAHRGELRHGDHAEYTLIDRKFRDKDISGLYLFATLEPCAPGARKHPKLGCSERIVNSRIKKVWVGIEDPDPTVDRKGIKHLQDSGVEVEMFDEEYQAEIRTFNRQFIEAAKLRALEFVEKKGVILSPLENTVEEASTDELSNEALQLYSAKAGYNLDSHSREFMNLLSQQQLVTYKKQPEDDQRRRVDVLPRLSSPQGSIGGGTIDYNLVNVGGRMKVVSVNEYENNKSFIGIKNEWIETNQKLRIHASSKTKIVDNTLLGFHFDLHFEDQDGRLYKQELEFSNMRMTYHDAELISNSSSEYSPTGLGLLLFGKNPRARFPQAVLKAEFIHHNGEKEIQDFQGALVLIPEQIESWLKRILPSTISRESFQRQTIYEYPIPVLREAIINALVHRDYDIEGAKIYLSIDEEKIVIKSPGLPVSPIKIEDFKKFKAPSLSRNPKITAVFNAMGYVEERGIGLSQMKSLPIEYGLPVPIITTDEINIIITFKRKSIGPDLTAEEFAGLDYLKAIGSVTKAQYAEHFHYDDKKAQRHLRKFREYGFVRTEGRSIATRYIYITTQKL